MPNMTTPETRSSLLSGVLALLCCISAAGQQVSGIGSGAPEEGVLVGFLEPWRKSEVACVETGLLQSIYVQAGDRVKTGDRLAELRNDMTRLQVELSQAQASAEGRIATARAEVALNERKVTAFKAARANASSSQLELERAMADLEIARGKLQAELDERKISEIRAQQMRQSLLDRTITAPIDGVVAVVRKQLGELVAPNAPEILQIVDPSKLRARFFLTPPEVRSLPKDRVVDVSLTDGHQMKATVETIVPVADKDSGLIIVTVLIDNPNQDILSSSCRLLLEPTGPERLVKTR